MAFSDFEKAMYAYIVGRVLPKGTTRLAAKATLAAAVTAGRAISPIAARGAAAALPPVARAVANPYVGIPLGLAAAGYATQQYAQESGLQEEINVARDEFIAALVPTAKKLQKRQRSAYNRAMSKAMAAVKKSTKGGPKGTLSNAKKTFGQVSKAVSRARKGGKLSPKGVTGVIKRSIAGMFKKPTKAKPKKKAARKFYVGR